MVAFSPSVICQSVLCGHLVLMSSVPINSYGHVDMITVKLELNNSLPTDTHRPCVTHRELTK